MELDGWYPWCEREQQGYRGVDPEILGWGMEVKHKKIWGYMMQINKIKRTLTPKGEKQVAYLVFCRNASSVPRSEWEGVLFYKGFPELAL